MIRLYAAQGLTINRDDMDDEKEIRKKNWEQKLMVCESETKVRGKTVSHSCIKFKSVEPGKP